MTREEAIDVLKDWDGHFIGHSSDDVNEALNMAIKALEQEPFINKPCVAHKACHEDKVKVLDKIRAEMAEEILSHSGTGEEVIQAYVDGLKKGLKIIDKYKESEET